MDIATLRQIVDLLPKDTPTLRTLETTIRVGAGFGGAWYSSQKVHLQRWLSEYNTPGPYKRNASRERNARFMYQHLSCATCLYWLLEAAETDAALMRLAFDAVVVARPNGASQCGAFRRVISWETAKGILLKPNTSKSWPVHLARQIGDDDLFNPWQKERDLFDDD
ncbi:hypothetical protein AB9F26_19550 [Falsihalocynthiibacter sp. BN13B15]|uniref:hypothetical protein n=1 Tax=Falsihalocynthiibacter sp. BN13B15 TaxID=3240871 RepID=UPI00350F4F7D